MHKIAQKSCIEKKKIMGTCAIVSVLSKFVHPSKEIRDKCPVRAPTHRLEGYVVIRDALKTINRCERTAIIFTHDDFPNAALYACCRHLKIIEEAAPEMAFNKEGSRSETRSRSNTEVGNDGKGEEVIFSAAVVKIVESVRLGGDVGDEELLNRRNEIEIDDDRDPLPENLMPVVEGAANGCHFWKYGVMTNYAIEELQ